MNLFAYVQNNPVNWIDPLGLALFDPDVSRNPQRFSGGGGSLSGSGNLPARGGGNQTTGEFSITNWEGYPGGAPRPSGSVRIIAGEEYAAARSAANNANASLRRADPCMYKGGQIHEIKPVKFGGSPNDIENKVLLSPSEHSNFTVWWNQLLRALIK